MVNARFGQDARRAALVERVLAEGYCSAVQLSRQLGVSEMTIRRDIKELAKGGLGRAVYGGITTLQDPTLTRTEFSERAAVGVEQKRLIAQEAVRHIPAASTIAPGCGNDNHRAGPDPACRRRSNRYHCLASRGIPSRPTSGNPISSTGWHIPWRDSVLCWRRY